jgi:hypothetical protein
MYLCRLGRPMQIEGASPALCINSGGRLNAIHHKTLAVRLEKELAGLIAYILLAFCIVLKLNCTSSSLLPPRVADGR